MALLVVKVLQLKVQFVYLLTNLSSGRFCFARADVCISVETAQLCEICEKELLLFRNLDLEIISWVRDTRGEVEEGDGLLAGLFRSLQSCSQSRVGDYRVDGHNGRCVIVSLCAEFEP